MTTSPLPEGMSKEFIPLYEVEDTVAHLPLFKDLPPAAHKDIARRVVPFVFHEDTYIFRQGEVSSTHNFLYIVVQGRLIQYGQAADGVPWLERTLQIGDVFGRYHLLFPSIVSTYETTVRGEEAGLLYAISAENLAIILRRWPDLWKKLIPEERIQRLRALPLYSILPDDHIRRLADHIKEKRLIPGEVYRLAPDGRPHVWVVAEGQIISVPATLMQISEFRDAPPETLASVGYVFVDGEIPTTRLVPKQVRAVSKTVLYGLPAEKFVTLVERFKTPQAPRQQRELLAYTRLPDIPALLARVDSLRALPDDWLSALRGFVAWIYTPPTQTLLRQGESGRALYILSEGEAILRAVDERGRQRPRSYLFPEGYVGRRALLHGTEHDVTVEATKPSYWLRLSREDLDRFNHYMQERQEGRRFRPLRRLYAQTVGRLRALLEGREFNLCDLAWCSVWERLGGLPPEIEHGREDRSWRAPDEEILWKDRIHMIFFMIKSIPLLLVLSILLAIPFSMPFTEMSPAARGSILAGLVLSTAILGYLILDYFNDFYALTDRRLVHRDRLVPLREYWEDIPLDRVQDVILQQSLQGRMLNYGTLVVQSAATGGAIVMERIPNPRRVQKRILDARERVRSRRKAWQRERLRDDLQKRLLERVLATWPHTATGPQHPLDRAPRQKREEEKASHQPAPSSLLGRIGRLFGIRAQPRPDQMALPWSPTTHWRVGKTIYWRKHRFNLYQRISRPLLACLGLVLLGILLFMGTPWSEPILPVHLGFIFASTVLALAALGWLLWEYDDWRNDLYVLTEDRLIDMEKRPFFFQEERRVAPLVQVQTVQLRMRGIFSQIFNFGDVIIKTAAAGGDLTFEFVANPREVAREIQRHLEEFRRKQEEREYERQQAVVAESLEIYNELTYGQKLRPGRRWERTDEA